MAKHIAKVGRTSKGQRRSCNKLVKRNAIIVPDPLTVTHVPNAMANAFLNIKIAASIKTSEIVDHILTGIKNKSGMPKAGRGWTANVSPRTLKKLIAEGVFA